MKRLWLQRNATGSFSCEIPADSRNRWCVLALCPAGQRHDMPARLRLQMAGDPHSSAETYVPPPSGIVGRFAVVYVAGTAVSLHADLFGVAASVESVELYLIPASRAVAGVLLALRQPARLLEALRGGRLGFRWRPVEPVPLLGPPAARRRRVEGRASIPALSLGRCHPKAHCSE